VRTVKEDRLLRQVPGLSPKSVLAPNFPICGTKQDNSGIVLNSVSRRTMKTIRTQNILSAAFSCVLAFTTTGIQAQEVTPADAQTIAHEDIFTSIRLCSWMCRVCFLCSPLIRHKHDIWSVRGAIV